MKDNKREPANKVIDFAEARGRLMRSLTTLPSANDGSRAPEPTCAPTRRETLEQLMAEGFEEKRRRHMLRRLTDALMVKAQIPDGNFLGAFFGVGVDLDNRQAVLAWVRQHEHLIAEAAEVGTTPLDHLYDALSRDFDARAGEGPR